MAMSWTQKRNRSRRVRLILSDRFPNCFRGFGEQKPPLKVGIDRDIIIAMPELTWGELMLGLTDYTFGKTYIENVIAGAARIDLNGNAVDIVTEVEAAHARYRFECLLDRPKPPYYSEPIPEDPPTPKRPILSLPKVKSVSVA